MTAPLQYGTDAPSDPTAVMGRRTLAWLADLLLYAAILAVGFASMAEYTEIPAGVPETEACDLFQQQNPGAADTCIAFDGDIYLLDSGESGTQTLLSFGYLVLFIVLQGTVGASPGKLLLGLRVVDEHGTKIGIGKSIGRTLFWVADAAPWFVPLVGPITAFTSTGHRRVGDMVAGTYVVSTSSVGAPVMPSVAAPPAGQSSWGAPPPAPPGQAWAPPTSPPVAPPTGAASPPAPPPDDPTSGRWTSPIRPDEPDLDIRDLRVPHPTERSDQAPPTVEADPDWSHAPDLEVTPPPAVQDARDQTQPDEAPEAPTWEAPTLPEVDEPATRWEPPTTPGPEWEEPPSATGPEPEAAGPAEAPRAEPAPFAPPGAEPGATSPPPSPEPEPTRYEPPPPQWDQARNTYIQWEPNQQAWLEWDAGRQRWKPIDS